MKVVNCQPKKKQKEGSTACKVKENGGLAAATLKKMVELR